jgi:hypothetical protein
MIKWSSMTDAQRESAVLKGMKWGLSAADLAFLYDTSRNAIIGFANRHLGGYQSGVKPGPRNARRNGESSS